MCRNFVYDQDTWPLVDGSEYSTFSSSRVLATMRMMSDLLENTRPRSMPAHAEQPTDLMLDTTPEVVATRIPGTGHHPTHMTSQILGRTDRFITPKGQLRSAIAG